MKQKIIYWIKIAIVMLVLFFMAVYDGFPWYWRLANGIWFVILAVGLSAVGLSTIMEKRKR